MAGAGDLFGVFTVDDKIYVDVTVACVAKISNERVVFFADLFDASDKLRDTRTRDDNVSFIFNVPYFIRLGLCTANVPEFVFFLNCFCPEHVKTAVFSDNLLDQFCLPLHFFARAVNGDQNDRFGFG